MFATIDTRSPAELAAQPAFREAFTLQRLGDNRTSTLALWTAATDPTAYAVEIDRPCAAVDRAPAAASVVWFDGPMSPARVTAARFGFERRIGPALAAAPGLVRTLVLLREWDATSCVVTLAVDLPALDTAAAAVNATELLPGEDPALLTGPDRVDIHHVTTVQITEGARS